MSSIASVFRSVLAAAALVVLAASGASAAAPAPAGETAPAGEAEAAADLKCHEDAVMGRGPGFLPSQKESADVAKAAWLTKAQAVFSDANWDTAKEQNLLCAKQGLYSNCTATAIPCGNEPGAAAEAPKSE
jgi:hypothetical protein